MAEIFGAHFVWIIATVTFVIGYWLGNRCRNTLPTHDVPSLKLVDVAKANGQAKLH